jgi:murein DD-endopeptidase MepM/ murein hydrolase activator NlpD
MHPTLAKRLTRQRMTQLSLWLSIGFVGGMGLLGATIAQAQNAPEAGAIAVPSAEELLSAPVVNEPAPVAAPSAAPIQSSPAPAVEVTPAPTVGPSVNDGPTVTVDEPIRAEIDFSELYIDPTDYSVGATRSAPTVVLSERSTGCEAAVQPGQVIDSSVCRAIRSYDSQQLYSRGASVAVAAQGNSARNLPLGAAVVQDFYNRTLRPTAFLSNGNMQLLYPLSVPGRLTSSFGWRLHPIFGDYRFHSGTDIGAPSGTPVLAAFSGRVTTSSFLGGYGLTVILDHAGDRAQTLYAHLSEVFVQPGETIEQGEVIGRVGSTGNSTGPHLHFEYREYTANGWVAMDAGAVLQGALANFFGGVGIAQLPNPKLEEAGLVNIESLADFGKLVTDVVPEGKAIEANKDIAQAAENYQNKAEVDLPEVVVPATLYP